VLLGGASIEGERGGEEEGRDHEPRAL
jgi:hypothetical protein